MRNIHITFETDTPRRTPWNDVKPGQAFISPEADAIGRTVYIKTDERDWPAFELASGQLVYGGSNSLHESDAVTAMRKHGVILVTLEVVVKP